VSFGRPLRLVVVDASAMVEVLRAEPAWTERFMLWQESDSLLLAPAHFRAEMANALLRSVRLDPLDVTARLRQLFLAGVDVVDRGFIGIVEAVELAIRHRLSVYDAAYLALALDLDGELATTDRALATAARAEGIEVIGTEGVSSTEGG
jgi:predicted nucleic acid-binding protein